jgi:V/A-type H+-transporting ATPase subunit D
MAKKIKLTRPELKRQRDMLTRFERYLPMLKLKQQQLQLTMREILAKRRQAIRAVQAAQERIDPYRPLLADLAGVNLDQLGSPQQVRTSITNVAGVRLPVFDEAIFPPMTYSLFSTPAWVDRALMDLREVSQRRAEKDILEEQYELLSRELTKIVQRVNLFEKVKIPDAREAIRRIRIRLGDEMTAAVGRAKIAKSKLAETTGQASAQESGTYETAPHADADDSQTETTSS